MEPYHISSHRGWARSKWFINAQPVIVSFPQKRIVILHFNFDAFLHPLFLHHIQAYARLVEYPISLSFGRAVLVVDVSDVKLYR